MKKTIICLLLLTPGGLLFAQDYHQHAPDQIQQSFHKDYPDANDARWSHSHGQWHANFKDQGQTDYGEMVAHYDRYGHHVDSHIPYNRSDVPAPVMDHVQSRYRSAHRYRFTRIEHPYGYDLFQVRVNQHGRDKTVYMDEQGRERHYDDRH